MNRHSYDAIAADWERARVALTPGEARILAMLVDGLAPGARILDLGCGTGRPIATQLVAEGFRIRGVDKSPAMLALAKARLPGESWVLADLESFGVYGRFDAVIAWDSLFHLPRASHGPLFRSLRQRLGTEKRFAFTAGGSAQPPFTDTMLGQSFFYDSHAPEDTLALLAQCGFRIVHHEFLNRPDGGRDRGRIAVVAAADSA